MGRIRRTTELGLLLLGGLIIAGTYTLASLGRTASLPADIVAASSASSSACWWPPTSPSAAWRPSADGLLLPLAGLLNGLGYVFIARTDERAGRPAGGVDRASGVGAFVVTLLVVRRVRDLERYRYTFALVGIGLLLLPLVPGRSARQINGARIWVQPRAAQLPARRARQAGPGPVPRLLPRRAARAAGGGVAAGRAAVAARPQAPRARCSPPGASRSWSWSPRRTSGSSLLFFALFVVMLWVATERASYLVIGVVMFAAGAAVAYQLFAHVRDRVAIWLDPWPVAKAAGFQVVEAAFALAAGGITGAGPGLGEPAAASRHGRPTSSSPSSARSSACSAGPPSWPPSCCWSAPACASPCGPSNPSRSCWPPA